MSATNTCPECGVRVPTDAPFGLCPRCLLSGSSSETAAYLPGEKAEALAAAPPAVDWSQVVQAVHDLDLVPAAEFERLAPDSGDDPTQLVRVLVRAKKLTPYQAGALLQGKARGLLIGRYLVEDKLGVGGMGVVFKARHRPSGRVVALKMLPPSFGREFDAVRRFRREYQIASRLSHPNLVAAIEASEDRGVHYLTMEYIPGYDLDRLVTRGGPMALKLALHCAIQVARGLEAAHAQGVIHRDIKPGNVMIDPSGTVRVLDLGLARVIEATSGFGQTAGGTLTRTGSYMGTVDFLAPEQADDARSADARSDVYGLGCTLYFLLTGKPPFAGDSVLKRLMAHAERPAPSLRAARPEVPEALEGVYLRMMAKRPADRPQSMSEVVIALEGCRTSAREAGDASADLKTFARTVLKRAPVRGRRGPDASVYARPSADSGGLSFDPDLRLEDLVGDYRDELGHKPLPEDKLPPIASRPLPKRVRRHRSSVPYGLIGLALIGLAAAAYALRPKSTPEPAPLPVVASVPTPTSAEERAQSPTTSTADSLQPGSVWVAEPGGYTFTILERQGERFKSRFVIDTQIREVNGIIKDGRLRWLARDVKVIAGKTGHDNEGEIRGDELAMTYSDPAGGPILGRITLRLQKPASGNPSSPDAVFRPLFNGKDLSGWRTHPSQPRGWRVAGGVLTGNGPNASHLYSDRDDYENFQLRLEARINDGGNSGVYLRGSSGPVRPEGDPRYPNGYEAQINSTNWNLDKTGSLRGGMSGAPVVLVRNSPVAPGQWFAMDMAAVGNRITVKVNDQITADYVDENPLHARGCVILQTVGKMRDNDPETVIEFRKIEVRELPPAPGSYFRPLFNGKDLAGWSLDGDDGSGWSVEDGVLVARGVNAGSRNYLITDRDYADFLLRFEVRLDPDAGSGIGLRSIPGEKVPQANAALRFDHPLFKLTDFPQREPAGTMHWVFDRMHVRPDTPAEMKPAGQWNQVAIELRGHVITASINGKIIVNQKTLAARARFPDGTVPALDRVTGRIGLQKHTGTVRFRNIEVRAPLTPLALGTGGRRSL